MSGQPTVEVTGRATLSRPADQVTFVIGVARERGTAGQAAASAHRALAALERILARYARLVRDQCPSLVQVHPAPQEAGGRHRAEARVVVCTVVSDHLGDLLAAVRQVRGATIGDLRYELQDPDRVLAFARKAAAADAQAAGRAHAESLSLTLGPLLWIRDVDGPAEATGPVGSPMVCTEAAVRAQFALLPGEVSRVEGT